MEGIGIRQIPIYAALTILAVPHVLRALRWRLQVEAVTFRLRRLDRLLEAGDQLEARRIMAAVKRDCAGWFGPDR